MVDLLHGDESAADSAVENLFTVVNQTQAAVLCDVAWLVADTHARTQSHTQSYHQPVRHISQSVSAICSDILVLKLISVLVFILFSFFIVGEILQPSGGQVQGKGILIAGMAPDLSYDITRSKRLNF